MSAENTIRSYGYRINSQDIDHTKRANIIAAGGYMLDAAGEDANRHGVGVAQLNERNLSWVLLRWAFRFTRLPGEYERVGVRTWVNDINRLMTTRNLIMSGEDGLDIGTAITNWAVIDLTTRKSKDISALREYAGLLQGTIPSPMELPVRLAPMKEGEKLAEHRVAYSDIDFNAHTNTMSYLRWVLDLFPLERFVGGGPGRVDMNFLHESRFGELLAIYGCDTGTAEYFEIRNEQDQAVCRISMDRA